MLCVHRPMAIAIVSALAALALVVGCGGNAATTDTVDLSFAGAIDQGTESLGFELPAMKSSEVQTLQLEEEELLGEVSLTGEDAPEVHAHGTTRVPIRFDIVGMGEFEATRWVVTITKQGSTPPADTFEKEASLAGRERAYLVFTGLSEGRWDTTLRLYGIRHGKAGSLLAQVSPPTTIDAEPRLLDFDATKTALTVHVDAASPPGVGDVAWTAATATPWLSVSPESGTGSGDITVTVDRTGLAAGIYTDGAITVTSGGIPMNVDVAMEVSAAKIAFVTDRDGNYEIYVANADGSGQTRLTNTPGNDELLPRWSPDRSKILFVRGDRLYTMDSDGSGQAMLVDVTLTSGDWSPDGTKIAANGERSGSNDIAVVNADGTGFTWVTSAANHEAYPRWSPDGTRLLLDYYTSNSSPYAELYTMLPDGTDLVGLTSNTWFDAHGTWAPDGSRIAFDTNRDGDAMEIYSMNADGTDQTRLTNREGADYLPCWSPDGTMIVYTSSRTGTSDDIYVMDADGSAPTPLIQSTGIDMEADW